MQGIIVHDTANNTIRIVDSIQGVCFYDRAEQTLLQRGLPRSPIKTNTLSLQKESVAARILEEQKRSRFDTIVVGGSKRSKTEELLFGNATVKLVREVDCPVVTVF